jgi:hypothetical protein
MPQEDGEAARPVLLISAHVVGRVHVYLDECLRLSAIVRLVMAADKSLL